MSGLLCKSFREDCLVRTAICRYLVVLVACLSAAPVLAIDLQPIKLDPQAVDAAFAPRRLALLVGVQRFADPRFHPLHFAEKDAQDVATFLRTHNATPLDRRIELLSENATAAAVTHALDELEAANTSKDDIVIVYFSSHGTLAYENATQLRRYAVLYDTAYDKVDATGVSLDYIQNRLSRLKSQRKALILGMCHSGSGKSQLPPDVAQHVASMKGEFFVQPLHEVSTAMMVLSASAWGQPAHEDEALKNDIYTRFLLDGLARGDGGSGVSLFEAHEFARSKTYDYTRGQQTPTALLNMVGDDPIILSGRPKSTKNPLIFADAEQFRQVRVYVDGAAKGTLWNPQRISPGTVKLTLVDPANPDTPLLDQHIYMQRDKAYSVSSLVSRRPSLGAEVRAYHLPLPGGIGVGKSSDLWAPGGVLRSSEFLGTRLSGEVGYFNRQLSGNLALDAQSSAVAIEVSLWRAALGLSFYPARDVALTGFAAVESLQISRTIGNATLHQTNQQASLTYAALAVELRFLAVLGQLYGGLEGDLYPMRGLRLAINGDQRPMPPLSAAVFLGIAI